MTRHGAPLPDWLERVSLPLESKQTERKVIMSDEQKREKSKENDHFAAACMPAASRRISLLVDRERSCASSTAVEVMRARSDQLRARSKRQPRLATRRKYTDQKRSTPIKRSKTSRAYLKYVDGDVLELNDLRPFSIE